MTHGCRNKNKAETSTQFVSDPWQPFGWGRPGCFWWHINKLEKWWVKQANILSERPEGRSFQVLCSTL